MRARKYPTGLVYEEAPAYDSWLKFVLGGILAFTLILGLVMLFVEPEAAWVMFGVIVFDAVLFRMIMPRRLQIYEDRVRIALGGPFAMNIPFANIKEARPASGSKSMVYGGIRLATSSRNVVEILRRKGMGVVISPSNREVFLEQFSQAMRAAGYAERAPRRNL